MTLYEAIFQRRSIRKYEDVRPDEQVMERIRRFGAELEGLRPAIRVKWSVIGPDDRRQVKGLFLAKAPCRMVLYSETCGEYRENAGYLMEQMSLYLHTIGIGSCYQGVARLKNDDETELKPVMVMAFGYPAEPLARSRIDFKRHELTKLAKVYGAFGKNDYKLLEAARLAPSAMNLQPWRFVVKDGCIHLFVHRPAKAGYRMQMDMNLFDAGIAAAHILTAAEELWLDVEYMKLESILETDLRNYLYVGSFVPAVRG